MMKESTSSSLLIVAIVIFALNPASVGAPAVNFKIDNLQARVWINEDSSIDIYYHVEMACESGMVSILPLNLQGKEFILGEAVDDQGNEIEIYLDKGGSPVLKFPQPIEQGSSLGFNFAANIQKIISKDEDSTDRSVLSFTPVTWNTSVATLKVLVVLPEGYKSYEVEAIPEFNGTRTEDESGRLTLVWEGSVGKNESYTLKIFYPSERQPEHVTVKSGWDAFISRYIMPNKLAILAALIILLTIIPFSKDIRRRFSNL